MSTASRQPSTEQPKQPRRSLPTGRVVGITIQIVLACGVGMAAGQALFSMRRPLPDVSRDAEPNEASSLPPMPVALAAEGTWTLGNSPLSLGVEIVAADDLAARLAEPPRNALEKGAVSHPFDDGFLSSIRSVCEIDRTTGGYTVYRLNQPRMRLRLFSTGSGSREQLVGGYLAYPRGSRSWTLVVGTFDDADARGPEKPHLLPLTGSARSMGARIGGDGRLQCEIVEARDDVNELRRHWLNAGWSVSMVSNTTGESVFSCTRGNARVRAHARREGADRRLILLLVDVDALLDIENQNPRIEGTSS